MNTLMLNEKDTCSVLNDANKKALIANVIREHNANLYNANDYVNEDIYFYADFTEIEGTTSYSLCSLYVEIISIVLDR